MNSLQNGSDCDDKLPKPEGEVGRPGRGGYNLQKALKWDSTTFDKVKVGVHLNPKVQLLNHAH